MEPSIPHHHGPHLAAPPPPPPSRLHARSPSPGRLRSFALAAGLLTATLAPGCLQGAESSGDLGDEEEEEVGTAADAVSQWTNIAPTGVASQSSVDYGGVATRAQDGGTDGVYSNNSVTHTAPEASPWWSLGFPGPAPFIGQVEIHNRTDCCSDRLSDFKLLAKNDDGTWQEYDHPGTAGEKVTFTLERTASELRVQLDPQGSTNRILSLAEVKVLTPPNLALGKAATQSSTASGGVASRAVDGNESGAFGSASITHTAQELSPWWQVDLGGVESVGVVEVYNRLDCCSERLSSFKLLVSSDGSAWEPYDHPGTVYAKARFVVNRPARHVKIQLQSTGAPNRILSLAEVRVYPKIPEPAPAPFQARAYEPTAPVGSLEGSFKVDGRGAASYSIPIEVPPGIGGMEPRLNLGYRSGGGNGLLGMGWALGGIPAITRCPRTMAQDGVRSAVTLDATSAFCLDGKRLIHVSGTAGTEGAHYRTELESFSRIVVHGDCTTTCNFEVTDKSGTKALFGDTPESAQPYVNGQATGPTRTWGLRKLTSPTGNHLTVSYTSHGGQLYPQQIAYTMNAAVPSLRKRLVTFVYEDRTDAEWLYEAGYKITTAKRLANIETHVGIAEGDALVRDYRLVYATSTATKRSLLTTVSVCDGLGVCLPATQLAYNSAPGYTTPGTSPFTLVQPQGADYQDKLRQDPGAYLQAGDFNGDGKTDFIRQAHDDWDNGATANFQVYFSNGDGTFTIVEPHDLIHGLYDCQSWLKFDPGSFLLQGDWNGDGKQDLMRVDHATQASANQSFPQQQWMTSRGDGTFAITSPFTSLDPGTLHFPYALSIPLDFDGDGRTDLLRQGRAETGAYSGAWLLRSTGTSVQRVEGLTSDAHDPPWYFLEGLANDAGASVIPGDFDGDGMSDFLRQEHGEWEEDKVSTFMVFLSKGTGFFHRVTPKVLLNGWDILANAMDANRVRVIPGDYNGDGKTDFLRQEHGDWDDDANGTFQVFFSRGDGTFEMVEPAGGAYQADLRGDTTVLSPLDYNGDGKTDFIRQEREGWDDDAFSTFALYVSRGDGTFDIHYPGAQGHEADWYAGKLRGDRTTIFVGDFNGDGKGDFLRQERGEADEDALETFQVFFAKGDRAPDTLKKITNGYGGAVDVQYAPLTDSAVHTKGSCAGGSRIDVQSPMYVVESYTTSNSTGTPTSRSFAYTGGCADRDGRGFLGFSKIVETDVAGTKVTTDYHTGAFPLTGNAVARTVEDAAGNPKTRGETTFTSWTTYPGVHVVLPVSEKTTQTEAGQSFATTKEYVHDAFGNLAILRDRGLEGTPADDVDTCTTYTGEMPAHAGNTGTWAVNHPTYTRVGTGCSVTSGACQCATYVDKVDRYYDTTTMNLTQVYTWDDRYSRWIYVDFTYDALGNVATRSRPGRWYDERILETNTYDPEYGSLLVAQTTTAGTLSQTSAFELDPGSGVILSQTDVNGNVTAQSLDGLGRVVTRWQTAPNDALTPVSRVVRGVDATGTYVETQARNDWQAEDWRWQREYLDDSGRARRVESQGAEPGQRIVVDRAYDRFGAVAEETLPYFAGATPVKRTYARDLLGRVTLITDPVAGSTIFTYRVDTAACPACATKTTTTEASGTTEARTTVRHDDFTGKIVKQVDAESRAVTFTYDLAGRRTGVTDAVGTTTTVYDSLGRVTSVTSPDRGTTLNHYAFEVWLSRTIDANGQITDFTYDGLGRVLQKISPDKETATFSYDDPARANSTGRLTNVKVVPSGQSTPSAMNDFSYTPDGAVATQVVTIDGTPYTLSSTYDPQSRLRTLTYPDGTVLDRTFNAQGALSRLATGNTVYALYGDFNANGQPRSVTHANGIKSTFSYDAASRLKTAKTKDLGDTTLLDYAYDWNLRQQITKITDLRSGALTQTFGYTPSGQLATANGVYGSLAYSYDSAGNLISKEGATLTYTGHRVTGGTGFTATYDAAGNRITETRSGVSTAFEYGAENRLRKVTKGGEFAGEFAYDFSGERVKKVEKKVDPAGVKTTTTHHVTPAFEVTFLPDGSRLETKYVNGPSGRVAAITTSVAAGAGAMLDFERLDSTGELFDKRALAGVLGYLLNRVEVRAAHPRAPLAGEIALLLALAGAALALLRRRAPTKLAAVLGAVRGVLLPQKTTFQRRHPIFAVAVPIVIASLLSACGHAPGGGQETFGQTEDELTAGENGPGYPVAGTHYFHQNHIGSSSVVTNASAAVIARAEYKPFGELIQSESPGQDVFRAKFAGKEWDNDAGLYYFNARYYDPLTGRFLTADTHVQGGSEQSIPAYNPYAYANNNPVLYTDPSGHFYWAILVGVITGAYVGGTIANGGNWNPAAWNYRSWQTWTGIGAGAAIGGLTAGVGSAIGGGAGLLVSAALSSLAMNGLRFAYSDDYTWKDFAVDVAVDVTIGVAMGGAMGGAKSQVGKTVGQRVAGRVAQETTSKVIARELAAAVVGVGASYAIETARDKSAHTATLAAVSGRTPIADRHAPPPTADTFDQSPVTDYLRSVADTLLTATGADALPGRTSPRARKDRSQSSALSPAR